MNSELILAIESSCDETAAAVVERGRVIRSNVISSQIDLHTLFGGVVPELASRHHIGNIVPVVDAAMKEAGVGFGDLEAVAVTAGPGLIGALLVGTSFAKTLAWAHRLPLVGVNHIEGHICANFLEHPDLEPPFLCLVVSGGHTHLVLMKDYGEFEIIGRTRDDAAGEAFDKIARAVGLGYPGGPKMDRAAKDGDPARYEFPQAHIDGAPYDFSFSGLKTAALNLMHHAEQVGEEISVPDLAASFQAAVVEALADRAMRAVEEFGQKRLVLAGGVAANSCLRQTLEERCRAAGAELVKPSPVLCTDNAAMIGAAGWYRYLKGQTAGLDLDPSANLKLGDMP